jgi:hypothetical protein
MRARRRRPMSCLNRYPHHQLRPSYVYTSRFLALLFFLPISTVPVYWTTKDRNTLLDLMAAAVPPPLSASVRDFLQPLRVLSRPTAALLSFLGPPDPSSRKPYTVLVLSLDNNLLSASVYNVDSRRFTLTQLECETLPDLLPAAKNELESLQEVYTLFAEVRCRRYAYEC